MPSISPHVNALKPKPSQRRYVSDGERTFTTGSLSRDRVSVMPADVNDRQCSPIVANVTRWIALIVTTRISPHIHTRRTSVHRHEPGAALLFTIGERIGLRRGRLSSTAGIVHAVEYGWKERSDVVDCELNVVLVAVSSEQVRHGFVALEKEREESA